MPLKTDYETQDCSAARALEVVGERWTLLVLRDCFFGVRRFSDVRRHLGIPRAVLATRLATLVDAGVLERREYRPGRDEYLLTERGRTLWPTLYALTRWGDQNYAPRGRRRVFAHAECDALLDVLGVCPACGRFPDAAEIEVRPGPGLGEPSPDEDPVNRALRTAHRLLTPLLPEP